MAYSPGAYAIPCALYGIKCGNGLNLFVRTSRKRISMLAISNFPETPKIQDGGQNDRPGDETFIISVQRRVGYRFICIFGHRFRI